MTSLKTNRQQIVMNHFTQRQLRNLLDVLNRREEELRARIADERERASTEGYLQINGNVGDEADQAFAKIRAGIENEMIDRHLNELRDIAAAHTRVTEGTFGLCIDCGGKIDYERLLARPGASRCAECQTLFEKMPIE